MSVKIERIEEVTIQDFARAQGLEIVIHEREPRIVRSDVLPYYANFKPMVETKYYPDHPILHGVLGNGLTPQAALIDLCRRLEGQYLVLHATHKDKRREFYAPKKLVAAPIEENVG